MRTVTFTPQDVRHIAVLANLPVTSAEEQKLADAFNATIAVVNQLFHIDVKEVASTYQVTGLVNVFREDEIETERMFTQQQALSNAPRTHNGFFVVDQIVEEK